MRMTPFALPAAALLSFAVHAHALAPAAPAPLPQQSVNDLRQEVDRLRQEESQRKAQLDAALARIKELETKLAAAEKAAKDAAATAPAAGSAPATAAPAATAPSDSLPDPIVPADPTVGPGGVLATMQADYLKNFASAPPPPANAKEQQEFELHLRKLESWCTKVNRDSIRSLTWIGSIDPNSIRVNGRLVSLALVFKNGRREFRVPITVDQGVLSRVRTGDAVYLDDLAVTAVVRPRCYVNAARADPGAFENTPLVAPYVEFGFEYDVKSILPAEKAKSVAPKGG